MYVRCLIVILVVALAEIFPTEIEACSKNKPPKTTYTFKRSCEHGGEGRPSCSVWCKNRGKFNFRCLEFKGDLQPFLPFLTLIAYATRFCY